jgi:hypothetical protein
MLCSTLDVAPTLTLGDVAQAEIITIPRFDVSRTGILALLGSDPGIRTKDGRVFLCPNETMTVANLMDLVRYPYEFRDIEGDHAVGKQLDALSHLWAEELPNGGTKLVDTFLSLVPQADRHDRYIDLIEQIRSIQGSEDRAFMADSLRATHRVLDDSLIGIFLSRLIPLLGCSQRDLLDMPHKLNWLSRVTAPVLYV